MSYNYTQSLIPEIDYISDWLVQMKTWTLNMYLSNFQVYILSKEYTFPLLI